MKMKKIGVFRDISLSFLLAFHGFCSSISGCSPPEAPPPPELPGPPASADLTPDGDGSILANTQINRYGLLAEDGLFGNTELTLSTQTPVSSLRLKPNDLLLLIQTQGATLESRNSTIYGAITDFTGAGRFELIGVSAVDEARNTVSLYTWCGGLRNTYAAATTQVIRVPQYHSLLIGKQASLQAGPWDGKRGGVIALRVAGDLIVDGRIDASGSGFRGGAPNVNGMGRLPNIGAFYRSYSAQDGGTKGESIGGAADTYALVGAYGRGAPGNGGGGGNRLLAGGGGGANGDNGSVWTGQGVMQASSLNSQIAWQLDPGFIANGSDYTTSSGGGRGGYSYSQQTGDPRSVGPDSAAWGGDLRRERGGLGGRPLPNDPKRRLFMGGGGGAGDLYQSAGGAGGNGGGIVIIIADRIIGNGVIAADGNNGIDTPDFLSGSGGGGGGGTLVVAARSLGALTLSATGGSGGNQSINAVPAAGPGGGGGGGYIATPQSANAVRVVTGGPAGVSRSAAMQVFPVNGATDGASGQLATLEDAIFAGLPFCSAADLSVKLKASAPTTTGRDPATYTIAVSNLGPSPAASIEASLQLPDTAEILSAQGDGWTCTLFAASVSCERLNLAPLATAPITVMARPPLSVTAALATARVTAASTDPNLNDNVSEATLDIVGPLSPRGLGGGLACQLGQGHGPMSAPGPWALLLAVPLLVWTRRWSQRRCRYVGPESTP